MKKFALPSQYLIASDVVPSTKMTCTNKKYVKTLKVYLRLVDRKQNLSFSRTKEIKKSKLMRKFHIFSSMMNTTTAPVNFSDLM